MPYRIGKFDTKSGRELNWSAPLAGVTYARRVAALKYLRDSAAVMEGSEVDAVKGRLYVGAWAGFHYRIVHVPPTPKPKIGKVRKSVEMPKALSDGLALAAQQGGTTVHGAMLEALRQYAEKVLGARPCDDPEQVPDSLRGGA